MEAILDDHARRAPVAEQCLLNTPRSVSGGSKRDNIDIIIHSNDQLPIVPYHITAIYLVYGNVDLVAGREDQ